MISNPQFNIKSVLDEKTDETDLAMSIACILRYRRNFCKVTSIIFCTFEIISPVFGSVVFIAGLSSLVVEQTASDFMALGLRSILVPLAVFFFYLGLVKPGFHKRRKHKTLVSSIKTNSNASTSSERKHKHKHKEKDNF